MHRTREHGSGLAASQSDSERLSDVLGNVGAPGRSSGRSEAGGEGGGGSPPPPPPRFKSIDNNVISQLVLGHTKCRNRTCEICGARRGWITRQKLLGKSQLWRQPAVFTLTIDRKRFSSPVAAFRKVVEGRHVARLMQLLGCKLWVWVLEYQQKTGNGWPHWHILVDLADLPGGRLDLRRAWKLWRDTWHLGGLDLSAKDVEFQSVEHALLYITKYLTKQPEGGYPTWVLKSKRMIRFVQGCRRLGPLVGDKRPPRPAREKGEERKKRRPFIDRMAECEQTGRIFKLQLDQDTGEQSAGFVAALPCSPGRILGLVRDGRISAKIRTETDDQGRESFILESDPKHLADQLRDLEAELAGERRAAASVRRRVLLAENKFAKRELLEAASLVDVGRTLADNGRADGEAATWTTAAQDRGDGRTGAPGTDRASSQSEGAKPIAVHRRADPRPDRPGGADRQGADRSGDRAGAGRDVRPAGHPPSDDGPAPAGHDG